MVIDVLTMLDPTLKSGPTGDIGSPDGREESFGSIFEERMKAENGKSDKTEPKPKQEARETNQVKQKNSEVNSDNEQTNATQTTTAKTEPSKTEITDEKPAVIEKISNEKSAGNEIELTEEQLAKLAALMGITLEEMAKLALLLEGKTGQLTAAMPDDLKKSLAQLLDTKNNGTSADQHETVAKLAELLDMNKEDAEKLLKQLRVFSMEIKSEENPAGKVLTDAQKTDKETHVDGKKADAEIDDLLNSFKKAGDDMKVDVKSAADNSGKVMQSNGSTQSVETDAVNMVKTGKPALTQTAAVKEAVETVDKASENKIIGQIVEKAKILSFPKRTHARIALKPPSLGWVDIKIVMHETSARATIVVESAAVKQTVDQNIDELKAALNQQGISVEEMNVSVEQQDARSSNDGEQRGEYVHNDSNVLGEDGAGSNMAGSRLVDEMIRAAYNSFLNITV